MKKYFLVILTLCASFCMAADTLPPINPDTLFPKDIPIMDTRTLVENDHDRTDLGLAEDSASIEDDYGSVVTSAGILPDNRAVTWYKLANGNTIVTQDIIPASGQNKESITNTWVVGPDNTLAGANTRFISNHKLTTWTYDGSGSLTHVVQGTQTWDLTKPSATSLIDAAAVPKTVNKEKVFNK